jgi:hypothetical protein
MRRLTPKLWSATIRKKMVLNAGLKSYVNSEEFFQIFLAAKKLMDAMDNFLSKELTFFVENMDAILVLPNVSSACANYVRLCIMQAPGPSGTF